MSRDYNDGFQVDGLPSQLKLGFECFVRTRSLGELYTRFESTICSSRGSLPEMAKNLAVFSSMVGPGFTKSSTRNTIREKRRLM